MSTSVYYEVTRDKKLSINEYKKIDEIIEYFTSIVNCENSEKFCYFKYNEEIPNIIFQGALIFPETSEDEILERQMEIQFYWLNCLTDIRKEVIKNANWYVTVEDMEIPYEEDSGYFLG